MGRRISLGAGALLVVALGITSRATAQTMIVVPVCVGAGGLDGPVETPTARTHLMTDFGGIVGGISDAGPEVGVAGLDAEIRHYQPTTWVFGARVVTGSGFRADTSDADPSTGGESQNVTGFGLWLAPLIGLHWTDETESLNRGYPGSFVGGAQRCDYEYKRRHYSTHVLAVEPVLWLVDGVGGGGHLVWEYDVYGDGREARYALTGSPRREEDYRFRSAIRAGYISRLGVGGMWLGTLGWGLFNLELGLGAYVDGDGASFLVAGGMGLFWM